MKNILDVSNIVYGGCYGSPGYRVSGFPCGGIRKLLGIVNAETLMNDVILCFDGESIIKKELLPRYKAGRTPNYSVFAQIDLLKSILDDCGIPYYQNPQYEADDFICSLVHLFTQLHDPDEIHVISDDHDLSCCVNSRCTLLPATTNGTLINLENYETKVVRGDRIPYNTILLYKMIHGDSSDNYLGVHIPGLVFDDFARFTVETITPFIESGQFPVTAFMDINVMNAVIDMLPDSYTEESKEKLKEQARIAFPQLIDVTSCGMDSFFQKVGEGLQSKPLFRVERDYIKVFSSGDFNQRKFDVYCTVLGLNRCRPGRVGMESGEMIDKFKEDLRLRAKDLSSGVTAVEYQKKKTVHPNSTGSVIDSMELPL